LTKISGPYAAHETGKQEKMNENVFRLLAGLIFFAGLGISAYFRRKADRESEEKVSRDVDGAAMKGVIQAGCCYGLRPLSIC
jgi:hypothetical protein